MRYLVPIATLVLVGAVPVAGADDSISPSRIRPLTLALRRALAEGLRRTTVVPSLVARIEDSNLIVHLVPIPPWRSGGDGMFRFVGSTAGVRYARIGLRDQSDSDDAIAMLAHELEHAAELADAPHVDDQPAFLLLYRAIGFPACGASRAACFDTAGARATAATVLRELRQWRHRTE